MLFGSALKLDGVQELLAGFEEYMKPFDGKKNLVREYLRFRGMIKENV